MADSSLSLLSLAFEAWRKRWMSKMALTGLRVLLVENNEELAAAMRASLEQQGCEVDVCCDGGSGLRRAELHAFDVLLLEAVLPRLDGLEVTKRLRLQGIRAAILILSDLAASEDVVRGLDAGADDFLARPFDFEVLAARVRARTRSHANANPRRLRFADLMLDADKREVIRAGRKLDLTRTEFSILEYLMRFAGRVARRDRLIEFVWPDRDISENNLDTFIRFLRQKVDPPSMPRLIHTQRGVGYCLREPVR